MLPLLLREGVVVVDDTLSSLVFFAAAVLAAVLAILRFAIVLCASCRWVPSGVRLSYPQHTQRNRGYGELQPSLPAKAAAMASPISSA